MEQRTEAIPAVDQALSNGRPWWQACCLGCGILLFAFAVTIGWFVHAIKGPGLQSLGELPPNMPKDIQIYRVKDASSIRYVAADQKRSTAQRILSPLRLLGILASSTTQEASPETQEAMSRFASSTRGAEQLQVFNTDTLFIEWGPVPDVHARDILSYYSTMLERSGFTVETARDNEGQVDIVYGDRSTATVQVDVKGGSGDTGIDEMRVVVNYVGQ